MSSRSVNLTLTAIMIIQAAALISCQTEQSGRGGGKSTGGGERALEKACSGREIVVDTDMGLDDARAVFALIGPPGVEIAALETALGGPGGRPVPSTKVAFTCSPRGRSPFFGLGTGDLMARPRPAFQPRGHRTKRARHARQDGGMDAGLSGGRYGRRLEPGIRRRSGGWTRKSSSR